MGPFALLDRFLAPRRSPRQFEADPLSPRPLERRRVLDASAASLLFAPVGDSSEFVQVGESITDSNPPPGTQNGNVEPGTDEVNTPLSDIAILLDADAIFENEVLVVSMQFVDPDQFDEHQVQIDWGDGSDPEIFELDPGTRSLITSHRYLDDNPTNTPFDINQIEVSVIDSADQLSTASVPITVNNIAPEIDFLSVTSPLNENDIAQLQMSFTDPGVQDTHTVEIDWGDGTSVETFMLDPGAHSLATSHKYLDDNPTGTPFDINKLQVSVIDDDGGVGMAEQDVLVNNVDPTIDSLSITTPIDENDVAQLTGTYSDIGTQDTFELDIDWDGDTVYDQTVVVSGGEFTVMHMYLDDSPTGTLSDTFNVNVRLRDDDTGSDTGSVELTINNLDLVVSLDPVTMINEDGTAVLTGSITDVGTLDTFTLDVTWGDPLSPDDMESFTLGTTVLTQAADGIDWNPITRTFSITHQYLDDNPSVTTEDTYMIAVKVTDDDSGMSETSETVLVKNVAPDVTSADVQTVDEGAVLDLSGSDLGSFFDEGTLDTHTATVSWGDGTLTEPVTLNQLSGGGSLGASHIYADNGVYAVTLTVTDDDGQSGVTIFQVTVNNVDPTLTGVDSTLQVNEGQIFTLFQQPGGSELLGLDVGLKDSGFDNPLNPLLVGGTQETFTAMTVDWGDGTDPVALTVVNRINGGRPGIFTTAEFAHAPHAYADNGIYTVSIEIADDDGGFVTRTFQIEVLNVAPTLTLTDRALEELTINESETLDLFDLATFTDPGFDNPANPAGATVESHTYTIDWGDGTVETLKPPATHDSGEQGVLTVGTLVDSHQYLDNDEDNLYTVTVTLMDDDDGEHTQEIVVRVLNVNPSLEPIFATDVNTRGETMLTLDFADPGTETLTVWIDWGDQLALPPAERFVAETFVVGPGLQNLTLLHVYDGPPDPLSPASDIVLSVFIRDDDFDGGTLVIEIGQSETRMIAITNPGEGRNSFRVDTTPQVSRLDFRRQSDSEVFVQQASNAEELLQAADLRAAAGDARATTDRFLELRVIDSTGQQSQGYRLKPEVLDNLLGLFRSLPDNHYAIYLVRLETNSRRLVIEFFLRAGKPIDPGDDSEGTRDRPPTDESFQQLEEEVPREQVEEDESNVSQAPIPAEAIRPDQASDLVQDSAAAAHPARGDEVGERYAVRKLSSRRVLVAAGLAATATHSSWAQQVDRTVAQASALQWRKLRRRFRNKQNNQ